MRELLEQQQRWGLGALDAQSGLDSPTSRVESLLDDTAPSIPLSDRQNTLQHLLGPDTKLLELTNTEDSKPWFLTPNGAAWEATSRSARQQLFDSFRSKDRTEPPPRIYIDARKVPPREADAIFSTLKLDPTATFPIRSLEEFRQDIIFSSRITEVSEPEISQRLDGYFEGNLELQRGFAGAESPALKARVVCHVRGAVSRFVDVFTG